TLAELGYLEGVPALASGVPEAVGEGAADLTEQQQGGNGRNLGEETHREVAAAYDQAMDEPRQPDLSEAVPEPVPHPAVDNLNREAATAEMPPVDAPDTTMPTTAPEPISVEGAPISEAQTSFAGLPDDAPPPRPPPARAEPLPGMTAANRSPRPAEEPHHLDDEDPTQVPAAVVDEDDEDVSVDLSAHLALDKQEVAEAVRSSRVHEVVAAEAHEEKIEPEEIHDETEEAIREAVTSRPPAPP